MKPSATQIARPITRHTNQIITRLHSLTITFSHRVPEKVLCV
jgi:hypothetical protein